MELKEGYIKDFISEVAVRATPEEIEAVQVFLWMLVDDYDYPKELIQTRPQWRVKARPSGTKKEYPADIGLFSGEDHIEDNIEIIIECKRKNTKDGSHHLLA